MRYIKRDLGSKIIALSNEYSCILLTGPRQVGKTTLLRGIMDSSRNYVTLDDLQERSLARRDPAMFLKIHPAPVLIDEVQYAPELFSYIKIETDNGAAPGSFWLTGSQAFRLMELSQESLAGRAAILSMNSLSQHEIYGSGDCSPFLPDLGTLQNRKQTLAAADLAEIYRRIWNGSLPGLASGKFTNRDVFYSSYVRTYIERDVRDEISLTDPLVFHDFVRAAACRAGQMLNVHSIAGDVGVSDNTAKSWLRVMEKSGVIFFLHPYSNNLLKRTLKNPKMYFFDTGLAAYLTQHPSPEILAGSSMSGAILENYVVGEIIKTYANSAKDCLLWYYRDMYSNEIDLVLESGGKLHPMEIKRAVNVDSGIVKTFSLLDKSSMPRGTGAVLCLRDDLSAIDSQNLVIPVWMI